MTNKKLFSPIQLRSSTLPNRIVISPMCQYSSINGDANEWHKSHYMQMAISGAGMFVTESTAISEQGRISYGDLGLYSDSNEYSFSNLVKSCKKYSKTPIACQLSHSGRKGSVSFPWQGGKHLSEVDEAWQTVSASPLERYPGGTIPTELSLEQIKSIREEFIQATYRAINSKIDIIELHIAHGYLLHQFYSPVSNYRTDEYGGSFKNRIKLTLEVLSDVRKVLPEDKPIGVRVTAQDWLDNGSTLDDCVNLVLEMKEIGIDYVCVSSGGIVPVTNMVSGVGYQVNFAREVKKRTGVITRAVGEINDFKFAENIINNGDVDLIAIGRGYLHDPRWIWKAASYYGEKIEIPNQYKRGYW